ncbi:ABC transporter ATP-binding protein [Desulfatitalea alkaliphila]|uniref:ABC transporter ATP-binding protein n=1 Tax=Desulfatitalea alkaliphila TaxID=2929485 RepID=A0AA41R0J1_9BACT|nr:ABC transporter ATP-binding protein [Desulfatitalea alkaliphila]MCJ8499999.1 ABC transporter ATP-binding protein [Desulfatitalea alkaliphila]
MSHIQIDNLTKIYVGRRTQPRTMHDPEEHSGDNVLVLNNINLAFEEGEMVCILGPSGCGKSTLLRIIAGFEAPTYGTVKVGGRKVRGPSDQSIFVFQHSGLYPWMTVYENVGLGLRHIDDEEDKHSRIQEHVEMVELEGFEHYYPHQLSGGMQRRAELARAIAVNPDLLIMDEPFSGLDFLTHMKMREEVVNMHEFLRKTTLVVTHDIDDALIMGDRIVVLSGRPSAIKLVHVLDFPRPRNFEKDPGLSRLRSEIFLMLGVPYAV